MQNEPRGGSPLQELTLLVTSFTLRGHFLTMWAILGGKKGLPLHGFWFQNNQGIKKPHCKRLVKSL